MEINEFLKLCVYHQEVCISEFIGGEFIELVHGESNKIHFPINDYGYKVIRFYVDNWVLNIIVEKVD